LTKSTALLYPENSLFSTTFFITWIYCKNLELATKTEKEQKIFKIFVSFVFLWQK